MKRIIVISLIGILLLLIVLFRFNPQGSTLLWQISRGGSFLLPLVSVAALLDSLNPCAFSILLLTIAFLFSIGSLQGKIFKVGIVYILGLFLVYMLIGLGILQTLHLFNTPHFMAKVGATLLIAFGVIQLLNVFAPSFPLYLKIPGVAHNRMAALIEQGSMPAAFVLGGLVGVCEFPCTGGPYLLVLGLLHDRGTFTSGLLYLLWYNFLFVLPLLLILFVASDRKVLERFQMWKKHNLKTLKMSAGTAMILLGIGILFL